jgi:hypothetical protein
MRSSLFVLFLNGDWPSPLVRSSVAFFISSVAFCHNRRCVKHLSFAETTQPSVWEGAGTSGEATVLPTPGGEIDDALQVMRLPRDDLSRVRQMIKAIDKFALVNLD